MGGNTDRTYWIQCGIPFCLLCLALFLSNLVWSNCTGFLSAAVLLESTCFVYGAILCLCLLLLHGIEYMQSDLKSRKNIMALTDARNEGGEMILSSSVPSVSKEFGVAPAVPALVVFSPPSSAVVPLPAVVLAAPLSAAAATCSSS